MGFGPVGRPKTRPEGRAGGSKSGALVMRLALGATFLYLAWAAGSALSAYTRYAWDDSFITYRYALNLAAGRGLRYNAADVAPSEGYSSLSHVLLVAAAFKLHLDPLVATRALSLLAFLAVPALLGPAVARALDVPAVAGTLAAVLLQIVALLTPATGFHLHLGMETLLFACSLAALAAWTLTDVLEVAGPRRPAARHALAGLGAALFVLVTRPEGIFFVACLLPWLWLLRTVAVRRGPAADHSARSAWAPSMPLIAAAAVLYVCWKGAYFGYLLPNPYYVKAASALRTGGAALPGWQHTAGFLRLSLPWFVAGLAVLFGLQGPPGGKVALLGAAAPGAAFALSYARAIHEAAPHFRFEFPYLVFLELLLVGGGCLLYRRFGSRLAVALAVGVLLLHATHPSTRALASRALGWLDFGVERADFLHATVGRDLARSGLDGDATLLTAAAGAIPYFSGFRTIDEIGLTDNVLSGRHPLTIAKKWEYIAAQRADVIATPLPPASADGVRARPGGDPVFDAPALREILGGAGSALTQFQDAREVREACDREMLAIRDHYTLGAAYRVRGARWSMLVYVRRDSPQRERLLAALGRSERADRLSDLGSDYLNDPRRL